MEMRVIDPSGRLILATREAFHDEFPDAPPLAYVLYQGRPVRVAGCEVLGGGAVIVSSTDDLREYYDFGLPGYYSAQVQVSAMVFSVQAASDSWLLILSSRTSSARKASSTPRPWPSVSS